MSSLGDFDASTVIYGKFTTYRPSTGAPFTLAGTPVLSVYKDNSTTQSTTGVTLTADFDAITGLHHYAIDTSTDGTFYAAGSFFDVVVTTGTVDSVSAVGTVVGRFTLRKTSAIKPTIAGRTLDVSAGGEAGIDLANVGSPTTALALTNTTISTVTDLTNAPTNGDLTATMKTSVTTAATAATPIAASVSGAVGSVTGNVGGTVASVVGAVGSVAGQTLANLDAAVSTRSTFAGGAVASVTGSVGSVVGLTATNLDVAVSTLATATNLATVAGYIDTEVSAIKAKTDNLPTDPADASDIAASFSTINSTLATIAGYVDTEVAAIKVVTDRLDTAMELDGAVYRLTTNALEQGPSGPGGGGLDAAGIRAAVGLASANLDTQLADKLSTGNFLALKD